MWEQCCKLIITQLTVYPVTSPGPNLDGMPSLTPAESELPILRSKLHSIESFLDDVLQQQAILLSWLDVLQQGAPCSSECPPAADIPGPFGPHSPSWAPLLGWENVSFSLCLLQRMMNSTLSYCTMSSPLLGVYTPTFS